MPVKIVIHNHLGKVVQFTRPIEYNLAVQALGRKPEFHLPPRLTGSDIYPQLGYIGYRNPTPEPRWDPANPYHSVGAVYGYKGYRTFDAHNDFRLSRWTGETPWQTFNRVMGLRLCCGTS